MLSRNVSYMRWRWGADGYLVYIPDNDSRFDSAGSQPMTDVVKQTENGQLLHFKEAEGSLWHTYLGHVFPSGPFWSQRLSNPNIPMPSPEHDLMKHRITTHLKACCWIIYNESSNNSLANNRGPTLLNVRSSDAQSVPVVLPPLRLHAPLFTDRSTIHFLWYSPDFL